MQKQTVSHAETGGLVTSSPQQPGKASRPDMTVVAVKPSNHFPVHVRQAIVAGGKQQQKQQQQQHAVGGTAGGTAGVVPVAGLDGEAEAAIQAMRATLVGSASCVRADRLEFSSFFPLHLRYKELPSADLSPETDGTALIAASCCCTIVICQAIDISYYESKAIYKATYTNIQESKAIRIAICIDINIDIVKITIKIISVPERYD
eukprot:jgi/Hompol1/6037/HPOL_004833-RA